VDGRDHATDFKRIERAVPPENNVQGQERWGRDFTVDAGNAGGICGSSTSGGFTAQPIMFADGASAHVVAHSTAQHLTISSSSSKPTTSQGSDSPQ
jgi:hypothetical protein